VTPTLPAAHNVNPGIPLESYGLAHLNNHINVPQPFHPIITNHPDPSPRIFRFFRGDSSLCDILCEEFVHEGEAFCDLVLGAVVEEDGYFCAEGGNEGDSGAHLARAQDT